jgi:hypothetical protein
MLKSVSPSAIPAAHTLSQTSQEDFCRGCQHGNGGDHVIDLTGNLACSEGSINEKIAVKMESLEHCFLCIESSET